MNHQEALAIGREIFDQPTPQRAQQEQEQEQPVRRARCKPGTRKRVCKVHGETVTDCFNPCSASAADSRKDDQIKQLKNDLIRKDAEIAGLKKRVNETRKLDGSRIGLEQKQKYIAALKDKDAELESIKKRANKTMKTLKHKGRVEKQTEYDLKASQERIKRLKDEKNRLDLEIHDCMSKWHHSQHVNQGLQKNNEDLMKMYKDQTKDLEKCKRKLEEDDMGDLEDAIDRASEAEQQAEEANDRADKAEKRAQKAEEKLVQLQEKLVQLQKKGANQLRAKFGP
jgi:hypothetical protein